MVPSRAPSVGIEDSIGIFSPSSRFWGHCYLPQLWFLVLVAQSCSTLCDSMDCRQLDSSVHGILQARILERVATPFSSRSSSTQGWNPCLLHCRQILYCLSHQRSPLWFLTSILFLGNMHECIPPTCGTKRLTRPSTTNVHETLLWAKHNSRCWWNSRKQNKAPAFVELTFW